MGEGEGGGDVLRTIERIQAWPGPCLPVGRGQGVKGTGTRPYTT